MAHRARILIAGAVVAGAGCLVATALFTGIAAPSAAPSSTSAPEQEREGTSGTQSGSDRNSAAIMGLDRKHSISTADAGDDTNSSGEDPTDSDGAPETTPPPSSEPSTA
ncbi:hypothetical protein, partial [Microbacterium sp. SD291]|uniref:hypothetical protein n=1 Tax=Microbacterium sp. SD291 TaxID=2782007 RepID=UPI001A957AB6